MASGATATAGARFGAADLLDTEPERAFDRITKLAAKMLDVPISLVCVLDSRRNFFKSQHGLPDAVREAREIPLSHSYCRHVVSSGEMLAVGDTLSHPLVGSNPTNEEFGVRAYLGYPVRNSEGAVVCSLCALDMRPRDWSEDQLAILASLAEILDSELALREEIRVRREAEERMALLLREMQHRVKNSLSTVQAIVGLSLRGEPGLDQVRSTLVERIASLSQTHSLLLDADWQSISLVHLLKGELGHYGWSDRVRLDVKGVRVTAQDAIVLGMVLHELATNAAKYGALSPSHEGTVTVECTESRTEAGGRRLHLTWIEDGVPLVAAPASAGFGSTLLDTLVVRQQRGCIERQWRPNGLHLVVSLDIGKIGPVERQAAASQSLPAA